MHFNVAIFKKHPYATAIGGVIIFLGVYLLLKNKTSSGAAATVSGSSGTNAYDLQIAQLQAGQDAASAQQQTALQVANLQAGVQNNQTNAAVATVAAQTAAQLAAIQAQTAAAVSENATNVGAQVSVAQIQANASTAAEQLQAEENIAQSNDLASINENQVNNQTTQQGQTLQYLTNVAADQTGLQENAQGIEETLVSQQLENQYELGSQTLKLVGAAGLNHGTTSLENDLTQITESVNGAQVPAAENAIASAGGQYASAIGSSPASIIGAAGGAAGSILSGLFA